jgi:hypothetical protein
VTDDQTRSPEGLQKVSGNIPHEQKNRNGKPPVSEKSSATPLDLQRPLVAPVAAPADGPQDSPKAKIK